MKKQYIMYSVGKKYLGKYVSLFFEQGAKIISIRLIKFRNGGECYHVRAER